MGISGNITSGLANGFRALAEAARNCYTPEELKQISDVYDILVRHGQTEAANSLKEIYFTATTLHSTSSTSSVSSSAPTSKQKYANPVEYQIDMKQTLQKHGFFSDSKCGTIIWMKNGVYMRVLVITCKDTEDFSCKGLISSNIFDAVMATSKTTKGITVTAKHGHVIGIRRDGPIISSSVTDIADEFCSIIREIG